MVLKIYLGLRDENRYGVFKANSNIGEIKIDISISGFGELFEIYQGDRMIAYADTYENEDSV